MKSLSALLLPAALAAVVATTAPGIDAGKPKGKDLNIPPYTWEYVPSVDTVLYPKDAYKLRRIGNFDEIQIKDSTSGTADSLLFADDTIPRLSARDTIKVPDSLRLTDPFRYRYYVALLDSLTHVQVRDSLKKSQMSHLANADTLLAKADYADWMKLDSLYAADSTVRARIAFLEWYNSLDKDARKKYDYEQKMNRKVAEMDSLRDIKEKKQAIRDSIVENTPRILETFALPDSMLYKRIISWKTDPDFHKMKVEIPDTSFNKYFYDYPFQRNDVNATWLGMAGSPVQTYNAQKRSSGDPADFITPNETWTYSMANLDWYNTKTPYTELAYWGTLIGKRAKESDNIHILTTQNITPGFNFRLSFDRWGGGGMLDREETANKTSVVSANYLGKRYQMHFGYIHNKVTRQENGGIVDDDKWIRDTIVDSRDIPIRLTAANSEMKKNSVFLEQQLRIPFSFINRMKASRDSTFTFDEKDQDLTTAFVGHSTEFTAYVRKFEDSSNGVATADSQRVSVFHNKVFLRLQPWSRDAIVSKIDVGIGDYLRNYYAPSVDDPLSGSSIIQNTAYVYAGVEGQFRKYFQWDAKADYAFAGNDFSDFGVQANARCNLYPFRRSKTSPLSIGAHFETSLRAPTYYQQHTIASQHKWDNDFSKQSLTRIGGDIDIPYWKAKASVGYSLFANTVYYDSDCVIRQSPDPVSVFSASIRKDLVLGNFLHLDNQLLFQMSSNQEVVPVPMLAVNAKYFVQFVAAKDRATRTRNVLVMQIGANAWYNTQWYSPGWNPVLGVFFNQNEFLYENGPRIDAFVNMQWKRACIFLKFENIGGGWPMNRRDFFTASHYVNTKSTFKIGIFWPFYTQPGKPHSHGTGAGAAAGSGPGAAAKPANGMKAHGNR